MRVTQHSTFIFLHIFEDAATPSGLVPSSVRNSVIAWIEEVCEIVVWPRRAVRKYTGDMLVDAMHVFVGKSAEFGAEWAKRVDYCEAAHFLIFELQA